MNKIYIFNSNTDAYGFVKQIACEKYNIDASALEIKRNDHGKPFFENLTDFHFNISHSGELKVLAVSDCPVGIDIEKLRTPDFRVAKRFRDDEYAYITENCTAEVFFEIWTKKEALLKLKGTGISGGLKSFSVFKTDKPFKTFNFQEYMISVCGKGDFEIIDLR